MDGVESELERLLEAGLPGAFVYVEGGAQGVGVLLEGEY
jgi:hypothetical protein